MYAYSTAQWLAFFYLYCFFGWCFESAYVSLKKRRPVNRGFMTGPYLPLYGSGAVLVLFVTLPVRGNYVLMYLAGAVAATILEYVTGVVMERLFGVRYWDYSNQKFNFQGQICLSSSIAWGFLTLFLVEIVHLPIERMVMAVNDRWLTNITLVFTVVFTFDFASSFRTAIDLRDVLIQAEKAKKELQLMQKRVEVLEAVFADEWNDSVGNVVEGIGDRVSDTRQRVNARAEEKLADMAVHMEQLKQRFENPEIAERFKQRFDNPEFAERFKQRFEGPEIAGNLKQRFENAEGLQKAFAALDPSAKIEALQNEMKQMRLRLDNMRLSARTKLQPRQRRMLSRNPSARSLRYKEEWQYLKDKIKGEDQDQQS